MKVSQLCLGTITFGGMVGKIDDAKCIEMTRRAVDLGINFIDTADMYARGRSEEVVGKAIRGMRDDIVLMTKVRRRMGPGPNDEGLSRKHIMKGVMDSLKRLGTDYIDVYLLHAPDPTTPLKETLYALNDLVRAGTVHYIGLSNFTAWQIEKALRISEVYGLERVVSSEPHYNILERDVERDSLPLCLEEGIGVTPYCPLAGGFLTGKYQPDKPIPEGTRAALGDPFINMYFTGRGFAILKELRSLSEETGLKMSQLSLAWLLANPAITAPIIGVSKLKQLEENIEVVNNLPPAHALERISDISKPDWLRQQEAREAMFRKLVPPSATP